MTTKHGGILNPEHELQRRIRLHPDDELFIRERGKRFREDGTIPPDWAEFFQMLDAELAARSRSSKPRAPKAGRLKRPNQR